VSNYWETKGWRKEVDRLGSRFVKGNKILWNTGGFKLVHHPEPSEWIEQWTVADIIDNRYCNHRTYKSFEEALEAE
jgi:hypothetical protein